MRLGVCELHFVEQKTTTSRKLSALCDMALDNPHPHSPKAVFLTAWGKKLNKVGNEN
jgi:hypothetical protein